MVGSAGRTVSSTSSLCLDGDDVSASVNEEADELEGDTREDEGDLGASSSIVSTTIVGGSTFGSNFGSNFGSTFGSSVNSGCSLVMSTFLRLISGVFLWLLDCLALSSIRSLIS